MEYQDNRIEKARMIFKKLIYDWTFESATFRQFMEFSNEIDDWDDYWYEGAQALKEHYDWYWCLFNSHSDDWDGFAEYFTNKIFDVIPEIFKDVIKDNGIEKGDENEKEIEINFSKYSLSEILYNGNDSINHDVVRYVYENHRDIFNEIIRKMLDEMKYYNVSFTVCF